MHASCKTGLESLLLVAAIALAVAGTATAGDESLLYYREGDRIVFTNTASRTDARPVPGFRTDAESTAQAPAGLPATPFDSYIDRLGAEFGISPRLIKSVALVESGFDPRAVSPKGAEGLMQLMPETARRYGVRDTFNPLENLRAGARHLRVLLDEFEGSLELALAAYNAGSGAVRRHGGVPDYPETKAYVRKVRIRMGRSASTADVQRPYVKGSATSVRLESDVDGTLSLVN